MSQPSTVVWSRRLALLQLAFKKEQFTFDEIMNLMHDGEYIYDENLNDPRNVLSDDRSALRKVFGVRIDNVQGSQSLYKLGYILPRFRDVFLLPHLEELLSIAQLPQNHQNIPPDLTNRLLRALRIRMGREGATLDEILNQAYDLAAWRDSDDISAHTRRVLAEACRGQHIVEFDYAPARDDDDQLRHHVVEPYEVYVHDGHFYLEGYCLQTTSHYGTFSMNRHFDYRIGRIADDTLTITENMFIGRRARKQYRVHYILSQKLAKSGGSQSFDEIERRQLPDGRMEIIATTPHTLRAVQKLLSYGSQCTVVGGTEVLELYRTEVCQMYSFYDWSQEKTSAN